MAKLIALYRKPADSAAFDRHYFSVHVPLAKTIPGLRGYEVSTGAVTSVTGESSCHLVAVLVFDSKAVDHGGQADAMPPGSCTTDACGLC